MQKNLIIGGLLVWNLILMAALIFLWTSGRRWPQGEETARGNPESRGTRESEVRAASGEEVFTFKAGDRKVGDQAPPVVNRDLTITATFDTQDKDGVIVAHGGLAQGYAVYVQQGQMFFVVRRHNALTTVEGEKVAAGRHSFTATFARTGDLSLSLDGKRPITGKAAGGLTLEPMDGFDVGGDRGAPVGIYPVPSDFGGTIEKVSVKTAL